ncbi:MAG: excinuclease ABC subunit UvrA [Chlorobi bacterium]|nr:excinuclease ABC subunit UvrA [Chlorobiota bacterium]
MKLAFEVDNLTGLNNCLRILFFNPSGPRPQAYIDPTDYTSITVSIRDGLINNYLNFALQKNKAMPDNHLWIELENVSQNNLRNISLKLPRNKFIVITGVSGSGKSSLAFDVINGEGRRKYFVNLSARARNYLGKLEKPKVERIRNLTPTIAVSQTSGNNNPRSTVGTLSEINDYLRLLFARLGKSDDNTLDLNRSLFSFNSPVGACPHCKGLGVEDRIAPKLLIEDASRTIRERAFKITNPKGYIIYSQVTIDALDEVCKAHGFSVDIPWRELSPEQQDVVLNGSDRIKIPYGKHTLESRMRWSGITAKPREEGYYKGILPVMDQILQRDRNPNILRFAKTQLCSSCGGSRLSEKALSVKILGKTIHDFSCLSLDELKQSLDINLFSGNDKPIAKEILKETKKRIDTLKLLGLAYLSLNRKADTLSGGEMQRIRLAKQMTSKLRNITFVFDEPSIGVHPSNNANIIKVMKELTANGNTVIVVEHDAQTILNADWIVEIGPGAGINGGDLLFNGSIKEFMGSSYKSLTKDYLPEGKKEVKMGFQPPVGKSFFSLKNAEINNLKSLNADFAYHCLNVVSGVSGAGKSSLINQSLIPLIQGKYDKQLNVKGKPELENFNFDKTIIVDRSPIGKTARSTPATYTKLHDLIRDLFASLDESKKRNFNRSVFSYNVKGGRCEKCEGAGKLEIGMHFLGNVETVCDVCNGKRFKTEVLAIKYREKSISDILNLSIKQAHGFFEGNKKIQHYLRVLISIGLGYIKLGQSSNSLSGGEAQRIRLASEIIKSTSGNNLFIFDEPTTGLHFYDIQVLLDLFAELLNKGNTIIAIEHNEDFIRNAHRIIDLGPEAAVKGGRIVFQGCYADFLKNKESLTVRYLKPGIENVCYKDENPGNKRQIEFKGVNTNNLKSVDVIVPDGKHTVITGRSGSGKSSLAFDTIFSESQKRFTESFPTYIRQFSGNYSRAKFDEAFGLTPVIALKQSNRITDPRSTLGTLTDIYDLYRLLYSRFGTQHCTDYGHKLKTGYCTSCDKQFPLMDRASLFSFNNTEGSCPNCSGLGTVLTSSKGLLVENPKLPIENGAFGKHKSLQFYTDPFGQYVATLKAVGERFGIDYSLPVDELSGKAVEYALFGTGNEEYDVHWDFKRKNRTGSHDFKGKWIGFTELLLDEYHRKHANGKGGDLLAFLTEKPCPICKGQRFKKEVLSVVFAGLNIHELSEKNISQTIQLFNEIKTKPETFGLDKGFYKLNKQLLGDIVEKLEALENLGLSYLNINRQTKTLSGGELQRALLSTHLKGGLTGITYILDEPSTGLHPSDAMKLNDNIQKLVNEGNTVITVEHNPEIINSADYLLELGPGAGENGGQIIAKGSVREILGNPGSLIGKYLGKKSVFKIPALKLPARFINIENANAHNLKNINVNIAINELNVITGVSGSGKTSLVRDVLHKSFRAKTAVNCKAIFGFENVDEIIAVDKNPLPGSSLSTPATFIGAFDEIRKLFAASVQAKEQKLKAGDFSFNSKSGQCPVCKGTGEIKVSLDFISDVSSVCESCNGKRYKPHILEVKYKGQNIFDILEMSVKEALRFFEGSPKIIQPLYILNEIGLGYVGLGQSSSTLSGGESQRLKIAREIISGKSEKALFIFDEPSRGLHPDDLTHLQRLFDILLKKGNTLVVVEHNPIVISKADHIIDLGPQGGELGGELIYQGDLKGLVKCDASVTGKFMQNLLG